MILHDDPLCTLYLGDCVEVMQELPAESVDAIVTDPPYGLEFMGKEWDRFATGRAAKYGKGGEFTASGKTSGRSQDKGDFSWFGSAAARPNYTQRPAKRCAKCGKQAWSGSPCKCEEPEWIMDNSVLHTAQAWHEAWAREAFRVAKPGAHLLAFGGTRTYHRLASAIEDAGWEIRDCLVWGYGSGFPKSLNVAKQPGVCHCGTQSQTEHDLRPMREADLPSSESAEGEREPVLLAPLSQQDSRLRGTDGADAAEAQGALWGGQPSVEGRGDVLQDARQLRRGQVRSSAGVGKADGPQGRLHHGASADRGRMDGPAAESNGSGEPHRPSASEQRPLEPGAVADERGPQARGGWPLCDRCGEPKVDGWGTALKPAWEPIVMARKPLRGTVAANVLAHGTGALNIDATRLPVNGESIHAPQSDPRARAGVVGMDLGISRADTEAFQQAQRESIERTETMGRWPANLLLTDPIFDGDTPGVVGGGDAGPAGVAFRQNGGGNTFGGEHAKPSLPDMGYGDSGTYSRFFLIPKSSRSDREPVIYPDDHPKGTRLSTHPTQKPTALMRHLVRLVTPPGGTVLDPFLGSGTTAIAANAEGFRCIGIEKEREYLDITLARMTHQPLGMQL